MGKNTTQDLPEDRKGIPLPLTPAVTPFAVTYDATISSSTTVTLNAKTTIIEVTAIDKGIFMRWGAAVSSSNFDEFIGAGQTRHYVVPTGQTDVRFIEESATAKLVVIEK